MKTSPLTAIAQLNWISLNLNFLCWNVHWIGVKTSAARCFIFLKKNSPPLHRPLHLSKLFKLSKVKLCWTKQKKNGRRGREPVGKEGSSSANKEPRYYVAISGKKVFLGATPRHRCLVSDCSFARFDRFTLQSEQKSHFSTFEYTGHFKPSVWLA